MYNILKSVHSRLFEGTGLVAVQYTFAQDDDSRTQVRIINRRALRPAP
ncbi:MAG: hypothetical protein IT308_02670 [Anaerolineaceae bacterium]|nr:hypothetical protein [Anaerolineaceae bacterium]